MSLNVALVLKSEVLTENLEVISFIEAYCPRTDSQSYLLSHSIIDDIELGWGQTIASIETRNVLERFLEEHDLGDDELLEVRLA